MSKKPAKPVKGTKLASVPHGSMTIKVGDCILLNPDNKDNLPYIAKVKEIIQTKPSNDDVELIVTWYYRPEEAVGGRKAFHGEKELFDSDHLDKCHKATIIGRCRVHSLKKYQSLTSIGDNDYFSRFTYRPAKREFEPDRVPVYCACEMPYNPDKFMVMCDECEEWYHPECLKTTKEKIDQLPKFLCAECKRNTDKSKSALGKRAYPNPPPLIPTNPSRAYGFSSGATRGNAPGARD